MKAMAVVFLHVDSYKKRFHYLILCHRLVSIISISPNHVYMINHPSFNFNFYNFDKYEIPHIELFLANHFYFAVHVYYMKDLKSIFIFQNFDIIHIQTTVKTQPIIKGVMKG